MTLIELLKNLLLFAEIAAFITALVVYRKFSRSHWKWFIIYLGFIVLAEFLGKLFTRYNTADAKIILYDYIVIPVEFLFFIIMYWFESKPKGKTLFPILAATIYIISIVINFTIFREEKFFIHSFSYTVGTLMLLILSVHYLFQLSTSDAVLTFKTNICFWVSIGLILFYVGSIPFFGMLNTLYTIELKSLFYWLAYSMYIVNIAMYCLFIIGLVWHKEKS